MTGAVSVGVTASETSQRQLLKFGFHSTGGQERVGWQPCHSGPRRVAEHKVAIGGGGGAVLETPSSRGFLNVVAGGVGWQAGCVTVFLSSIYVVYG